MAAGRIAGLVLFVYPEAAARDTYLLEDSARLRSTGYLLTVSRGIDPSLRFGIKKKLPDQKVYFFFFAALAASSISSAEMLIHSESNSLRRKCDSRKL